MGYHNVKLEILNYMKENRLLMIGERTSLRQMYSKRFIQQRLVHLAITTDFPGFTLRRNFETDGNDTRLSEVGWRTYINALRKHSTYADQCVLTAAAYLYGVNIHIIYANRMDGVPTTQMIKPSGARKTIHLGCYEDVHSESIMRMKPRTRTKR